MPTRRQLFTIWESQFEFFGGFGLPKANYIGTSDGTAEGHGLTDEKYTETPLGTQQFFGDYNGKEIGELRFDSEHGDLQIVIK